MRARKDSKCLWGLLLGIEFLTYGGLRVTALDSEAATPRERRIIVYSGAQIPVQVSEAVFFAFDDRAIPFKRNLALQLVTPEKHPANPVLPRGKPGSPDATWTSWGTVLHINGKFRMWYTAIGTREQLEKNVPHLAYAESVDGIHWSKPKLGQVEYGGSNENNLIDLQTSVEAPSVLYDPDDPNPERRYKMVFISHKLGTTSQFFGATSPDGIRWRPLPNNPPMVAEIDLGTLYRFGGLYYSQGHGGSIVHLPDGSRGGRLLGVFRSPDFDHWSPAYSLGFYRSVYALAPGNEGEEVHVGSSVWNRGNVLVGLYGQWHGAKITRPARTSPEKEKNPYFNPIFLEGYGMEKIRIDLGIVVSNDGMHWREPIREFRFIPRGKEDAWDGSTLIQMNAFINVREKTYIWYSAWTKGVTYASEGEIGLATLPRDRLGFLYPAPTPAPPGESYFLTCPVQFSGDTQLFVNAEGLEQFPLTVEVQDYYTGQPLSGYSEKDCVPTQHSGLRELVSWKGKSAIEDRERPVVFKVIITSGRQLPKVYALYLVTKGVK